MELKTIIGKEVLLEKLRENRDRYVDTRKALLEVFKKKDREYLKARAEYGAKIYEGTLTEDDEQPCSPTIPVDRSETYTMYIEMVDKHCGDTLEIDSGNFNRLYMDKWDFIREHIRVMTTWADADASLAAALTAYGGEI